MFSLLMIILLSAPSTKTSDKYLERAKELEKKGETEAAIVNYEKVLQMDPANSSAISRLGILYLLKGMNQKARDRYEKITKLNPKISMGWYILGYSYKKTGDCKKSIEAYKKYISMEPGDADPWYNTGMCLETLGNLQEALSALNTYLSMEKGSNEKGWTDKAKLAIIRIKSRMKTDKTPENGCKKYSDIAFLTAIKHYKAGNKNKALEFIISSLRSCPSHLKSLNGLASLTIETSSCSSSEAFIESGLKHWPKSKPLLYVKAWCQRHSGKMKEAALTYMEYLKYYPDDPDVLFGLGETMRLSGKNSEAVFYYQLYLKNEVRKNQEKWKNLATDYIAKLKESPEKSQVQPVTRAKDKILDLLVKKMGNEALSLIDKALKTDPENTKLTSYQSWAYFLKKDYSRAKKLSEKVRQTNASNTIALRIGALSCLKLRMKTQAAQLLEKYLIIARDLPEEKPFYSTLKSLHDALTGND